SDLCSTLRAARLAGRQGGGRLQVAAPPMRALRARPHPGLPPHAREGAGTAAGIARPRLPHNRRMQPTPDITLRPARREDVPAILALVRGLAEYEQLSHEVEADEATLAATLFGERPCAEVVIAEADGTAAGFALFFHTYSTFLARPGLYLEDPFVEPELRGRGIGRRLLAHPAPQTAERGRRRFAWPVRARQAPATGFSRSLDAVGMDGWTTQRVSGGALHRLAAHCRDRHAAAAIIRRMRLSPELQTRLDRLQQTLPAQLVRRFIEIDVLT